MRAELRVLAGWAGGMCPSPELWEQLGQDGPWSAAQKGKERVRDSSLTALGATVLCWGLPKQGRVGTEGLRFVFRGGKQYTKSKGSV